MWKVFDNTTMSGGIFDDPNQNIGYNITSESTFKNPIYLTIVDYPSRIKGDFKVKIK